jgi:AcrR family transcriptional regulator
MSKSFKILKTEDRILTRALEMFNERGIEYVGLRELAADLDMRVSNITYYFPTKDDLVNRISLELNKANSQVLVEDEAITMRSFLEMFEKAFHNHMQFRCLMVSFVHVMTQNKIVAERYKKTQEHRSGTNQANLLHLVKRGYLRKEVENEIDYIVNMLALIARFWVSEATVSMADKTPKEQIRHYSITLAKFFLPYATAKGRREIEGFIGEPM